MKRFAVPISLTSFAMTGLLFVLGVAAMASVPMHGEMLILRGIAGPDAPHGLLDDESAKALARTLGYVPEVIDAAADDASRSQVQMAVTRIREDDRITALYGFSGGGYNAQTIWAQLSPGQRARIRKVIVIGSPGVTPAAFPGSKEVVVQDDPPEGHMAGPKVLLQAMGGE